MAFVVSVDQMGRTVEVPTPVKRIVSLVPSQTEFLFDIGLQNEIVGVTRFCIHPKNNVQAKEKIGGTKAFNIEKIKLLNPDLIIGNKEENYEEGITELEKLFPVWMSDITDLSSAYSMMEALGYLTGKAQPATELISNIKSTLLKPVQSAQLTAAYFIWRQPYMVAANGTFINEMLNIFGVKNVFSHLNRYPVIQPTLLANVKPDLIFLSSEPYLFKEKHKEEFMAFSQSSKVMLVDGEMFSWYGSRLRYVPQYFEKLRAQTGLL